MNHRLLLPAALLLAGCAQVRELGGGPRDTSPPQLVEAFPPDRTTGFSGRRVVLRFDEKVKVGNVRDQLLVSPPLERQPTLQVQGGTEVVMELEEDLRPGTTYSFFFGDAIADLTEGNRAADLHYVVSTGDLLDTGRVSGAVIDAVSGAPAAGVHALLYAPADTADLRTGRPAYATRTNEQGIFLLKNLRAGSYALRVLRDQNSNLRYDLPNEEIAFADSLVITDLDTLTLLRLFREAPRQQQVLDQRVEAQRDLLLAFALPTKAPSLQDIDITGGSLTWEARPNAIGDTVRFWPSDTTALDGRRFEVRDDGRVLDTLRYRVREKMPFNLSLRAVRTNDTFTLEPARPLVSIDPARFLLAGDSVIGPAVVRFSPEDPWAIGIDHRPGDKATRLLVLPKAVMDRYGGTNDTLRLELRARRKEELGDLGLTVVAGTEGPSGALLVRLRTAQGGVVRTERLEGPAKCWFPGVEPGSYRLELIEDRNGNGRWDTGDLATGRQPERTWWRPAPVTIRAGWTIEETWTVDGP